MSFRVSASNHAEFEGGYGARKWHQIYGNHEFPSAIRQYLVDNGAELDIDDCFEYFEIKDLNGFLEAMLVAHNEYMKDDSYWDFKPIRPINSPYDLIMHCVLKKENSYAFIVYNFYEAFEQDIEWKYENGKDFYKIKEGKHIFVSGG